MATDHPGMLEPRMLNDADRALLDELHDGRLTPALARELLADSDDHAGRSWGHNYLGQRLRRLEEHGHVADLYDTGVYELRSDPLEADGDAE